MKQMKIGEWGFVLILILIPFISATYSGDSETILLSEQFDYYSIVGNSTLVDLNIIQNGLEITIIFDKYQQTDNFTIIFFNKEKEIITQTIYSGGGGGSTKYVDRNVTIEIPKFYDRNITNIEYVNNESVIEKQVDNITWKDWVFLVLFISIGIILGWSLFHKPKEYFTSGIEIKR